jgi:DNA-binding protein WhiA
VSASSLADDVRAELAAIAPTRRCDRLAEISALFHTAGTVHLLGRGAIAFHLDLVTSAVTRRGFALLGELRVPAEIRTYASRSFAHATRYQLHVDGSERTLAILAEAGVLGDEKRPLDRPPGRVVARPCCRGAYLRGAFLGAGSLSGPRSPHLEVRTPTAAGASFLRTVASAEEVRLRVQERASHTRAYAKGWEEIEGYLLAAGVVDVVLALEERSVVAEMRSEANRLANADHANLVRTAEAAQRQLEAVRSLRAAGTLGALPERLREAAELRLKNPASSLRELAALASPPATRAGMHRRLAKVVELAEGTGGRPGAARTTD